MRRILPLREIRSGRRPYPGSLTRSAARGLALHGIRSLAPLTLRIFEAARRYTQLGELEARALVTRLPLLGPGEAAQISATVVAPGTRPWPFGADGVDLDRRQATPIDPVDEAAGGVRELP